MSRDHYWENFYHYRHDNGSKHDMALTAMQSFGRLVSKQQSTIHDGCQFFPIWRPMEGTLLQINDSFDGVLSQQQFKVITDRTHRQTVTVETYFQKRIFMRLMNSNLTEPGSRLKSLHVRAIFIKLNRAHRGHLEGGCWYPPRSLSWRFSCRSSFGRAMTNHKIL